MGQAIVARATIRDHCRSRAVEGGVRDGVDRVPVRLLDISARPALALADNRLGESRDGTRLVCGRRWLRSLPRIAS